MQISLEALEQAFAPIEQIGQGELTFDVGGINITVKVLVAEEETEIQRFATQTLDRDKEDESDASTSAIEYLERFKLDTLAHAIVAIGNQDFRNTDFIELPEKTPSGTPIKVKRHIALRKVVAKWSTPLRTAIFRKYTELLKSIEESTEKAIKFTPTDIDTEIERLERKIEQLKEEKKGTMEAESVFSKVAKGASDLTSPPPVQEPVYEPEVAPQARKPITPTQVTPVTAQDAPVAPQPAIRPIVDKPVAQVAQVQQAPVIDDSFIDLSDDAAIERENQRLFQMRQQQGMNTPQAPNGSVLDMVRNAKVKANADAEAAARLDQIQQIPPTNDTDVYRMPPEELAVKRGVPKNQIVVDKQGNGTVNPRFRVIPKGP